MRRTRCSDPAAEQRRRMRLGQQNGWQDFERPTPIKDHKESPCAFPVPDIKEEEPNEIEHGLGPSPEDYSRTEPDQQLTFDFMKDDEIV